MEAGHSVSKFGLGLLLAAAFANPSPGQGCMPTPAAAVAWWPLDGATGTAVEELLAGATGNLVNGASTTASGRVRGAAVFDGVDDFISVADDPAWDLGAGDFTIELWARFASAGGGSVGHPGDIFIGQDEGPGTRNKWFFALGGGVLNFHINGPSTGAIFAPQVPFSPTVGVWYHLAVVRSVSALSIYVDGALGGTAVVPQTIPPVNAPLTIGQAENIGFMSGALDEVTLYRRALSGLELAAIAAAGPAGKCVDLDVRPPSGGNAGSVTVHVQGPLFAAPATVGLERAGQPTIAGRAVTVAAAGTSVDATLDLAGAAAGAWDVVIDSNGQRLTLPGGFTVVDGGEPDLWMDIVGLDLIQPGFPQTFWVTVGNRGQVDSGYAYALLRFPDTMDYDPGAPEGFPEVPNTYPADGFHELAYGIPPLAAGASVGIPLRLTVHSLDVFELRGAMFQPVLLGSGSAPAAVGGGGGGPPILWDPSMGNPPPGYVVLYESYGGASSVAISLGDGTVSHFVHNEANASRDGLHVHPFNQPQATKIIQPPGWTQAAGDAMAADFFSRWTPGTDIYDGIATSYSQESHDFPDLNCINWARYRWPALRDIETWARPEPRVPGNLYYWLYKYWADRGQRFEDYDWRRIEHTRNWDPSQMNFLQLLLATFGIGSFDPNDKVGPSGTPTGAFVAAGTPMTYSVFFENLPAATAPAKIVRIVDALDPQEHDLGSLALGPIAFAGRTVVPPANSSWFQQDVSLLPAQNLIVRVTAGLNQGTGALTWNLTAIDPATGEIPSNPSVGFLPPNVAPPEGEGSVTFTVRPAAGLPTGATVDNSAEIVFDFNPSILTPAWTNQVDADLPVSGVAPLPGAVDVLDLGVAWTASDVGAGVADVTIYVSVDGGPLTAWQTTTQSPVTYVGTPGHTYGFATRARDLAGNRQPLPAAATTMTAIVGHPALQVSRRGTPPNPDVLLPGVTSAPVIGSTWDPVVDHTTFAATAGLDVLVATVGVANATAPPPLQGTVLCDLTVPPLVFLAPPGTPFGLAVPRAGGLIGLVVNTQAAAFLPDGTVLLTNALDITIGNQ